MKDWETGDGPQPGMAAADTARQGEAGLAQTHGRIPPGQAPESTGCGWLKVPSRSILDRPCGLGVLHG